ncbi:uncharacterized protein [Periplaneta americana]|uniref:uncharacterized protein n=1 Tax=Periplaneta americana TaxID=6978 RepID=UPI0037E8CCF3
MEFNNENSYLTYNEIEDLIDKGNGRMPSNVSKTNELELQRKLGNNGPTTLFNGNELLGGGDKNESFNISKSKDRPTSYCSLAYFGNKLTLGNLDNSTEQPEQLPVEEKSKSLKKVKKGKNKYVQCAHNIQSLPEIALEKIFWNLSLSEISDNIQLTCRTFQAVAKRILRLEFKNVRLRLQKAIMEVETRGDYGVREHCLTVCVYKILESELLMLRAACARQVESGLWIFMPGKTIEDYTSLIKRIKRRKVKPLVGRISNVVIQLNKISFDHFDDRYKDPFVLNNMKLFGIEIMEILVTALNMSGNMTVIYNTDNEEGSCFIIGQFSILHCSQLETKFQNPDLLHVRRKAILTYFRFLTRANNCDTILRKINQWNRIIYCEKREPSYPLLRQRKWRLDGRFNIYQDYVQDIYTMEAIEEEPQGTKYPNCNMRMECNFELVCPKSVKPLDIKFVTTQGTEEEKVSMEKEPYKTKFQHSGDGNGKDNYNCSISTDMTHQVLNQIFQIWEDDETLCLLLDKKEEMMLRDMLLVLSDNYEQHGMKIANKTKFMVVGRKIKKEYLPPETMISEENAAVDLCDTVGRELAFCARG